MIKECKYGFQENKNQTCFLKKVYLRVPTMKMQNLKTSYSKVGGKITKEFFWFV